MAGNAQRLRTPLRMRAGAWAVALLLGRGALEARAGSGGPDAAGYSWHDVSAGACPVESDAFVLTESGSFVQNFIGPIPLGFAFPFYERTATQAWVNRSGLVFLGAPADVPYSLNGPIPDPADPNGMIAAYWDELLDSGPPVVYWERFASLGYFKFSISRRPVGAATSIDFEVYLYESGDIRVEYLRAPASPLNGTIGIESFDGSVGLEVYRDGVGSGGSTFPSPLPHAICFQRRSTLDCSAPLPVTCGSTASTTRSGTSTAWSWSCFPASFTGSEAVHEIRLDAVTDLLVTLSGAGTRELGAFLVSTCDESACITGGMGAFGVLGLPPGTYLIVVDAETRGDEGDFVLEVDCTPVSVPITCGQSLAGDTTGGPARLAATGCVPPMDLSGPESYFTIDFVPSGNLDVTVSSSTGQGVFIHDASAPLNQSPCLAGGIGGAALFAPPAGPYVIVVDGPASSDGPFTLSVRCVPNLDCRPGPPLPCNGTIAGSTATAPSLVDTYSCSGLPHPGPESVYSFENPVDQVVSFLLDDSLDPALDLLLLEACDEGACLAVGDDEVNVSLAAGSYFVVVDSLSASGADYSISTACGNALLPPSVSFVGAPGECFDESKTAWLTPAITRTDVLLSIDLTASMIEERDQLAANLQDIVDQLETFLPDVAFGLASYKDYVWLQSYALPCPYDALASSGYGIPPDYPYRLHQPITTDRLAMQVAVNALPPAGGGLDLPESYSRMLYEAAVDPAVGWRPGARRVLINFGDQVPHDCNVLECLGQVDVELRGIDLGRDGLPNSLDDLRILEVVQELVDAGIMLLHFDTSGGDFQAGGHLFDEVWDCWAARTGGLARTLNTDGTVPVALNPDGLPGLIRDVIRDSTLACDPLELVATPGYEGWLVSVVPAPTSVDLPAIADFEIRICIPPATPAGVHDFEVLATCGGRVVASQQVHVEVVVDCTPVVQSPPADAAACEGGTARLDARGLRIVNCTGTVDYEWTDGSTTWTTAEIDVSPSDTTTYSVSVTCSTDAACTTSDQATVEVHRPPLLGAATAVDVSPCDTDIELTWPDATFRGPSGTGTYAVYRSETSCADALTRATIASGLLLTTWTDRVTTAGISYTYVVEAEDDRLSTPCTPIGATGGAAAHSCTAPVVDAMDSSVPAGVFNTLRVRHARAGGDPIGHLVTAHWAAARALLAGEHFHLLKTRDVPTAAFFMANPEQDVSRSFTEDDRTSPLQFFDLRVASPCEVVSEDEYPPGLP